MSEQQRPPLAKIIPTTLEKFDDLRTDNYFWLNDRENPEVIDYLNKENQYYQEMTAHTKAFQKELFEEMKARIKEDDQSVPYLYNGYYYITRFETGSDYPIYSRKKGSLSANEEIMFNFLCQFQYDYITSSGKGINLGLRVSKSSIFESNKMVTSGLLIVMA